MVVEPRIETQVAAATAVAIETTVVAETVVAVVTAVVTVSRAGTVVGERKPGAGLMDPAIVARVTGTDGVVGRRGGVVAAVGVAGERNLAVVPMAGEMNPTITNSRRLAGGNEKSAPPFTPL